MTAATRVRGVLARMFITPLRTGRLTLPPPGLVVLAAVGGVLLLTVAVLRWGGFQDEHAYWLAAQRLAAGLPLYDPTADPATPYAYWYPPPLAQVLAPFTPFVSDMAFSLAWTVLLLVCLAYLADWRLLVALALVAFLPVAVELWFRNVHLIVAALAVIALRRWPVAWVPAAALKITPVIGVGFLLAARRYRDAALVAAVGAVVLAISIVVTPGAWSQFLEVVAVRGGSSGASLVPVPFPVRFAVALALAPLQGHANDGAFYPPVALWLFAPFTVLPPVLWWAIPLGCVGMVLWRLRPDPRVWPVLALCLWWPQSFVYVINGSPVMWASAALSLGVDLGGTCGARVAEPSFIPFALWGV